MDATGDAVVQVEGLHKRYGANGPEAVKGIDFEIRRREIFGLLGRTARPRPPRSARSPRACGPPPAACSWTGLTWRTTRSP
jgi:hypothetical protein